ncbi:Bro-N domain-containing protein [Halomonas sp. M4R1S46]|uniref:BRO-N domain-containing protein n=1 Tax=Halomonas sp. M4R1S46 TaxID=2982692 RepID=UPI0021E4507D|nr:BRO family protein [Halomonas sp. M4R1S46]UYG09586.1 BRO family protein [Halomonas sp. M4R1S46]
MDIRVVDYDGEPWFVAKDVCAALELGWDRANKAYAPSRMVRHLSSDEKARNQIANRGQRVLFVSESGLYKLVMRSDKPQARPFQDWVTKVVLPTIRKEGAYLAGEEHPSSGFSYLPESALG